MDIVKVFYELYVTFGENLANIISDYYNFQQKEIVYVKKYSYRKIQLDEDIDFLNLYFDIELPSNIDSEEYESYEEYQQRLVDKIDKGKLRYDKKMLMLMKKYGDFSFYNYDLSIERIPEKFINFEHYSRKIKIRWKELEQFQIREVMKLPIKNYVIIILIKFIMKECDKLIKFS